MARKAAANVRNCARCRKNFELAPKPGESRHVVPALWADGFDSTAPTVYFCSNPCYEEWVAEHRHKPIVHTDRTPPPPKSTAVPIEMFSDVIELDDLLAYDDPECDGIDPWSGSPL